MPARGTEKWSYINLELVTCVVESLMSADKRALIALHARAELSWEA